MKGTIKRYEREAQQINSSNRFTGRVGSCPEKITRERESDDPRSQHACRGAPPVADGPDRQEICIRRPQWQGEPAGSVRGAASAYPLPFHVLPGGFRLAVGRVSWLLTGYRPDRPPCPSSCP